MKFRAITLVIMLMLALRLPAQEADSTVDENTLRASKKAKILELKAKYPLAFNEKERLKFSEAVKSLSMDPDLVEADRQILAAILARAGKRPNERQDLAPLYQQLHQKRYDKVAQRYPELQQHVIQIRQFNEEVARIHEAWKHTSRK